MVAAVVGLAGCGGDDATTPIDTDGTSSSTTSEGGESTSSQVTTTSGSTTGGESSSFSSSSGRESTEGTGTTDAETTVADDTGGRCGDDVAEGTEVCDGADLAGEDCTTQGFDRGTLACTDDCSGFDTSACGGGGTCGNDVIDGDEVCDGADLADETCVSQGAGDGALACADDCSGFDTDACSDAGAGGCCSDNGSAGCEDVACTNAVCASDSYCCVTTWDGLCADIAANTPECSGISDCPECGNGELEALETCDGDLLGGQTCAGLGFASGDLGCTVTCDDFDVSGCVAGGGCCSANGSPGCEDVGCHSAICAFDPFCCESLWHGICAEQALGEPACEAVSDCPNCGNGAIDGVEPCDGDALAGESCSSLGYVSGTLACADTCLAYDETSCQGDGACCAANGTVGCEDMGCTSAVCAINPACCDGPWDQACADLAAVTTQCQGVTGCPNCGNAALEGVEVCDGDNLDGESCASLGLTMGTLACASTCIAFDTTGCFDGECCVANATPNCEDQGCSAAICAADPYCCEVEWDGICASSATTEPACSGAGGCP